MEPVRFVVFVGSLRASSVNRAAARAAINNAPPGITLELHAIADVPFYNGDVEDRGLPDSVARIHEVVADSDGVIWFLPEYNGSFPAVAKNTIDWLSRPPRGIEGKVVAACSSTPGPRAGQGVRDAMDRLMRYQPVRWYEKTLGLGSYSDRLDENGEMTEASVAEIVAWLEGLRNFAMSSET